MSIGIWSSFTQLFQLQVHIFLVFFHLDPSLLLIVILSSLYDSDKELIWILKHSFTENVQKKYSRKQMLWREQKEFFDNL